MGNKRISSNNVAWSLVIVLSGAVAGLLRANYRLRTFDRKLKDFRNEQGMGALVEKMHAQGTPYAFYYVDLDDFKKINSYGHDAGDRVIEAFAKALFALTRPNDEILVRIHGDEFAVVVRNGVDPSQVASIEKRICEAASTVKRPDGRPLSATVGSAISTDYGSSEEVIKAANGRMHEKKGPSGRR